MFSKRLPSAFDLNRLARSVAARRDAGAPFIDLTLSNPTKAAFTYPPDLLAMLSDTRALAYDPAPFGSLEARRAVSADYARRGFLLDPARIVLTASTSEAYSVLFRLLADPGDDVLTPRPSYPLFDYLTRMDGVVARPYALEYHGAWTIDLEGLARAMTPRTRAVLLVHPNNPTGSFVRQDQLDQLAPICAARDAAIISDEVFADYVLEADGLDGAGRVLGRQDVLAFVLGGLSKQVGLPQVKLGWIGVTGPDALVAPALERLELICDTYLSVSTPVQVAATALLEGGAAVRRQIQLRVAANYAAMKSLVSPHPSCEVLRAEGGWYAILRVPSIDGEERLVLDLLERDDVLVHPGYFFDFPREAYLVVSLLLPEVAFAEALRRVLRRVEGRRS